MKSFPTRSRTFGSIAVTAILLLALTIVLTSRYRSSAPPEPADGTPAKEAPAFTLRQFDGQETSLAALRGRTVVLNFWASWCVPCREEMPLFEDEWRAQRDQGLAFVGVALDDDEQSLTSFMRALNVSYPAGLDFDGRIARAYEVKGLPTTVVISPSGNLVRRWQGPIDRERLDSFVAQARAT